VLVILRFWSLISSILEELPAISTIFWACVKAALSIFVDGVDSLPMQL
jgi:hypothetical protein